MAGQTLAWLGGTEEEIARGALRGQLLSLEGQWRDRDNGSLYTLVLHGQEFVDVLTVRASGRQRPTSRLIRACCEHGAVVWTTSRGGFVLTLGFETATWTRGARRFVWDKLQ